MSDRAGSSRVDRLARWFDNRLGLAKIEKIVSGMRWAEGPVWFGDGRFLLWSDIPNNRIMKWDEETGAVTVFRKPSNNSNGLTRDRMEASFLTSSRYEYLFWEMAWSRETWPV